MEEEEERRIGVYVCHCGLNIAGTVDCEKVAEYAGTLPSVVIARDYRYMCSDPGQELIKSDIREFKLNRVVVASCSPRLHEKTFREACYDAGLNPYLCEHISIREQCSWVHDDKAINTEKAKSIVRAAVRRVYWHEALEVKEAPVNTNVLIVGGGIAGIQAALDIGNSEHKAYLVERDPSIGGHMIQYDRTFPTLDCSECIETPKMTEVGLHPYIELLTYSEVEEVSGSVGNFKVKVRKKARSVDEKKCVGCDECEVKCPWKVPSEFEMGLGKRGAIYIPSAVAVPNIPVIDRNICAYFRKGTCRLCEKVCKAEAIDFSQEDQILELEVGSIIVATGFDLFDPSVIEEYGYGKYENVFLALHFERFTCAGGATRGKILLRDGREPKSVAIVHCVGSRDVNYYPYCSRVCCMYGLKYAYLCKEFLKDVEVYNIYIDIRTFGEAQEEFYQRVSEMGVNFIRGRVGRITEDPETKKLNVHCSDTLTGKMLDIPVDMVVLNPAMTPCKDVAKVASIFNLSQRGDGFFLETHMKLAPVETPTSGVFIAGCCAGPKDIPDTVAQASAAAGKCLSMISKGRVSIDAAVAHVDETRCQGCGQCEETCTFSAPKVISKNGVMVSEVNEALCKGCGACSVVCPSGAISVRHYHRHQVLSMIEAFTEFGVGEETSNQKLQEAGVI